MSNSLPKSQWLRNITRFADSHNSRIKVVPMSGNNYLRKLNGEDQGRLGNLWQDTIASSPHRISRGYHRHGAERRVLRGEPWTILSCYRGQEPGGYQRGGIEKYIPKSNIWETVKRSTATEDFEEEFKFEALCTFGKKYHPEPREHKTIMNRCGKMW